MKFWIPDQLLTYLFTTPFIGPTARDIDMGAWIIEEKSIVHAQYLDLVYSRYGMLYDVLHDAPRPITSKALPTPFVDGVIGSIYHTSRKSSKTPMKNKSIASTETTP